MDTYIVVTLPDIWSPIYHPCEETNLRWSPYDFKWIREIGTHMIKEVTITSWRTYVAKIQRRIHGSYG